MKDEKIDRDFIALCFATAMMATIPDYLITAIDGDTSDVDMIIDKAILSADRFIEKMEGKK